MHQNRVSLRWLANAALLGLGVSVIPLRAAAEVQTAPSEVGAYDTQEEVSEADDVGYSVNDRSFKDRVWLNYYGIYYGSSITNPNRYQSGPYTQKDQGRPVFLKNFVTAGYDINDRYAIAATGYFTYTPSAPTQQFAMQDPSVRIANNSILNIGGFNWYGDARIHFAVSDASRLNDLLVGFQTFHYFSYTMDNSRWSPGIYASARYNHFGKLGSGNDLDLYFAPAVNYSISDSVALTFLYELGATHSYGDDVGVLDNQGTDFQPGVLWHITPSLEVNPYLNVYTGGRISLDNTSFGMTLSWMML
jgi:hypothetical protein